MSDSDSTADLTDRAMIQSGTQVGSYKILSVLGEGGFGVVYLAERERPVKRRVALKVIKPGMDSRQIVARFEAERQALAVMDHTNVAKVFDAGMTDNGRSYFVMEYVKGVPITEHCDRQRLGVRGRVELFIDVCEAVQHAHQKGIIHRDLKPRNILVSFEGSRSICKVIDFGVAKAITGSLTEKTLYTEQGQAIGTPEYMSPEQAEMTSQDIDTRSDVYSLGVVLYELLTGLLPFTSDYLRSGGLDHIRRVIREEEPPTPSTRTTSLDVNDATKVAKNRAMELRELRRELKGDLDWIVLKAMEKDRQRRYETAHGLAMDIQRYLDNEPIIARPPSSLYRLSKMVRRNKGAFVATAAVIAALVVGLAAAMWGLTAANFHRSVAEQERDDAREARRIAVQERTAASLMAETRRQELYVAQVNLAHQAWRDGDIERAQNLLALQLPERNQTDLRGFGWRYLWKLCQDESRLPLATLIDGSGPWWASNLICFSADGSKLAIADGKTVRVWEYASRRELTPLHPQGDRRVTALAFSPTNTNQLAIGDGDRIVLWDLASDVPPSLLASSTAVGALAFSPDGKKLASASGSGHGRVEVWDVVSGAQAWSKLGHFDRGKIEPALCVAFSRDGTLVASGGGDTKLKLWDAVTGNQVGQPLEGHSAWVLSLDFSPDRRRLASSGFDARVLVWDVETGQAGPPLLGHRGPVKAVAFSPDGQTLVSGGQDSTIRCWDVATSRQTSMLRGHTAEVLSLAFSPDGRSLVSTSNKTLIWDAPPHVEKNVLDEHSGWLDGVILSPDGSMLAVPDYHAHAVKLWDVHTRSLIRELPGHGGWVKLAISPNGKFLAAGSSGSTDETVRLWDLSKHEEIAVHKCDSGILSVSFSPDDRFLSATSEGGLKFWSIASGSEIELIGGDTRSILHAAFSPGGGLLAVHYQSGKLIVWDTNDASEVTSFDATAGVKCLSFSADQRFIAAGNADSNITLFDVKRGKTIRQLQGHTGGVNTVTFTPDSKTLASASGDSTVRLWNVATGQVVLTVEHIGPATGVSFSNDGMLMATSGADAAVRLWRAASLSEADASLRTH